MGRARDALVDDPQGIYLRENGVPAEFATMSAVPSPSKEPAGYPLFPFTNKKGKLITKTSKPRNSWIIYRAERHAAVKAANPTLHVSQLCKYPSDCSSIYRLTKSSCHHQRGVGQHGCRC